VGYVLSHPKFGEFLRTEYFDEPQISRVQQHFAHWGREILSKLNSGFLKPDVVPTYLIQNLSQHFADTNASLADFMQFVEEGWLHACEPPRVCRRLFGLSYAAMAACSSMA
jgi:hypothetical protein